VTLAERLASVVEETTGIVVHGLHLAKLEELVIRRARASGTPGVEAFVDRLRRNPDWSEWQRLLGLLTIKESSLFRAPQQFRAIEEFILPAFVRSTDGRSVFRVWCAGCARGEEAATIAVVLHQSRALAGRTWRIVATDVDEAALEDARRGEFSDRAMARVPGHLVRRYFARAGDRWALEPELLAEIEFRRLNLISSPLDPPGRPFDLILLRNVLIYFRPEAQRRVVAGVVASLAAGGALFLGPSESLRQLGTDLAAHDLGECFVYRHRERGGPPIVDPPPVQVAVPPPKPPTGSHRARPPAEAHEGRWVIEAAVEALATLDTGISVDEIAASGRMFPEHPVLRSLEGIARDRAGDLEGAVRTYRAALYLEPGLYQVRLLLARCLDRLGRAERAAAEYRAVLAWLAGPSVPTLPDDPRLGLPTAEDATSECRKALAGSASRAPVDSW
jgi:chemotaxis protein methyltransferase CheR